MANTLRNVTGDEGMKFFPFVFSLFMFILFANLIGLIPYGFTVTSHLDNHGGVGAARVFHGDLLRLLEERIGLAQAVCPVGYSDVHDPPDRRDRAAVLLLAPNLTQRPPVRQHAGRAYHAQTRRRFHRHAWWGGICRLAWRARAVGARPWHSPRSSFWSLRCRPSCSPSSLASISTTPSIPRMTPILRTSGASHPAKTTLERNLKWIQLQPSTLAPVWLVSAWAARPSASPRFLASF